MSELYMSNERYLAALKRIRDIIASGVDVKAENSNAMGDKYSSCTWGLCDDGKSHWLYSPLEIVHGWLRSILRTDSIARWILRLPKTDTSKDVFGGVWCSIAG
jgi:hypothetical protein